MATSSSSFVLLLVLGASAPAWPREAASSSQCETAATQPPIAGAIAKVARDPDDLRAQFALADAWSDAGCFNEAVNVLQSAEASHPQSSELKTRLRVARSLVGEEHFFDDLDRADTQARLKRATFRCETLSDLEACAEALRVKPDDPSVLTAQGNALVHARRPADALASYRRAEAVAPGTQGIAEKIRAAQAELGPGEAHPPANASSGTTGLRVARSGPKPTAPRLYSNSSPVGQSH